MRGRPLFTIDMRTTGEVDAGVEVLGLGPFGAMGRVDGRRKRVRAGEAGGGVDIG